MTTQIVVPVTIDKKPYHAVIELSEIPLAFRCVFCRTDSQIGLANIACNVRLLKLTHASGERVQRTLSSDSYQIAAVRLDDTIERKGPVCAECFGSSFHYTYSLILHVTLIDHRKVVNFYSKNWPRVSASCEV